MDDHDTLHELIREHVDLASLMERDVILRAALHLLMGDEDGVAWAAAPRAGLVIEHARGARTGEQPGFVLPMGCGLTGKVYQSGRAEAIDDYRAATSITHAMDAYVEAEGIRRILAVPVVRHGATSMVLAVGLRDGGTFGERAFDRAKAVADRVSVALAVAERSQLAREVAVGDERSRIAAELHDSVGALLFAIGSGVAGLIEQAAGNDEMLTPLRRVQGYAEDASGALRASLRTLRSSSTALSLAVSLRGDCAAFADRTGIPAELLVLDHHPPPLDHARTQAVVAAVREALLNIEKHAQASTVVVTIGSRVVPEQGECLLVAVTDDGVGLPDRKRVDGIGLSATADAIGRLGGALYVGSEGPDAGTLWRVILPR